MDLENLLTPQHKLSIVRSLLEEEGARGFRLNYDRRYGWTYSVIRRGEVIRVTFSVNVTDPRFARSVESCAEAIARVKAGEEAVFKGRGPFVEEA